jgi:hypothetical protein
MSSFFEFEPPPQPPEPPPQPLRRPWHGAPHGEIGRAVALNLIPGRSDKAALWISAATVYTDGFEFEVEIRHRLDEELLDPFFMHVHHLRRRGRSAEGLDPGLLRFGIQFSDGGKATNLPDRPPFRGDPDEVPDGPVLWPGGGGGGGGGRWRTAFWVWPLPPEGALTFVCEWPIADIPETRTDIDSALIRDAAAAAVALWPEDESGDASGTSTHQVILPRVETSDDPTA